MAITTGTPGSFPIDFGVSEALSGLLGTQVGAYNPNQSGPVIGQESVQNYPGANLSPVVGGGQIQGPATSQSAVTSNFNATNPNQTTQTNLNTQTTPTGGGTRPSGIQNPTPTDNSAEQQQVESAYQAAMDYLNKAEMMVKGFQPQVEAGIQSTYDTNAQLAGTQKAQGERAISTAQSDVGGRLTSAISAARQALQESLLGGKQRFGSGSNIYKALGEYGTTKFQQAQGSARDTAEKAYSNLAEQSQTLNENFTNAMTQLNNWKTTQLATAQQEFMAKLMEINSDRSMAEQNKSIQKIQLLQDMRNRADAIKTQAWTFAQNLELQRQSYAQQFSNAATGFGNTATAGANAANVNQANAIGGINMTPISATSAVNPADMIQTGAITKKRDAMGNVIK